MKNNNIFGEFSEHILSIIYRISSLLTTPSPIDKVVDSLLESVTEGMGFNRSCLYLINKEKDLLECMWINGFSHELEESSRTKPYNLKRHDSIETKVALTGEPLLIKDVYSDPILTPADLKITKKFERGCILYVPLKVKGEIIGILGVDKRQGEPEIDEKQFESLSIFANYASIIIENSRLYEALLNEKMFSEDILNSSVSGILTTDIHGKITSLNPAAENILGANKENILNKFVQHVFTNIPEIYSMFYKTISVHENIKGCECSLKNDKNIILSISSSPIFNDKGALRGVLFLIYDITSERERDERLQRMNRLISLGELAAGVAHEIRNPLTGINVVLDIFKDNERLTTSEALLLDEAKHEIVRLEKLVSDLLDFARPKRFNFEKGDINEIVRSICSLISEQCNNQRIRLAARYGNNIPSSPMDNEKIRQALLNIIINAIQSMPQGGDLTIETGVSEKNSAEKVDNCILVHISDTGAGISEEIKDRIYDPFFTTNREGTGLGLSITYSIIKEHRGTIRFDSNADKGTTFILCLPADPRIKSRQGKVSRRAQA
ncbi:MAG: ATP-binding protein [Deltaproteobacteria bacterium]|nr:ATP-binding protein [Deltaproteobacteria bacterium]